MGVEVFHLDGVKAEKELWFKMWTEVTDIPDILDILKKSEVFFPTIRKELLIMPALPCTTSTVERSFSSLRRIKTWLRSTTGERRLIWLSYAKHSPSMGN